MASLLALTAAGDSLQAQGSADRGVYERAVALVMEPSPLLRAARADRATAIARLRSAGRGPAAELAADIEEAPAFRLGDAVFSLALSRDFLPGGWSRAARGVVAVDLDAADRELAWQEQAVRVEAERNLTVWLGWRRIVTRLGAQDSLLAQAEVALRDRLAAGVARYADVLRVQAERLRIASEQGVAASEANGARAQLEALAGDPLPALSALLDTLLVSGALPARPPDPGSPDDLIALAPSQRRAEFEWSRRTAERTLAQAEAGPRLRASLGAQLAGEEGRRGLGPMAGLAVSLPFTAAGANRAAVAAAGAAADAADARRTATRARNRAFVVASLGRYHAALERVALFETGLLAAVRAERGSSLDAYAGGELSLLELLDFERAVTQAEIDHLRALMDVTGAWADLWLGAQEGGQP